MSVTPSSSHFSLLQCRSFPQAAALQDKPAPVWVLHRPWFLQDISNVGSSTGCSMHICSSLVSSTDASVPGQPPPLPSLTLAFARLFLRLFASLLTLLCNISYSFLNMFSQWCHQLGWWAQLCPAVGPCEAAGSISNTGQLLTSFYRGRHPTTKTLPQTPNTT